jgi:two-component system, response regulator PdtaR
METHRLRILCVEDDNLVRQLAVDGLRDAGYEVVEAKNGAEAIELMRQPDKIGMIFTDVQMPGSPDGVELVAKIRQDNPGIPAIITSGFSPHLTERLGFLKPPTIFIGKPYSLRDVLNKVKELVTSRSSGAG